MKLDAFFGSSSVRETAFPPALPADLPPAVADQFNRLPPHDLGAERALIGAFVLAGDDRAAVAQIRAAVTAADFFSADYGAMFAAAAGLVDAGRPLDAVALRAELAARGVLADVGGAVHLAEAVNAVPNYAHAAGYAATVREAARRREVIREANAALRWAYSPSRAGGPGAAAYALEMGGRLARVARDADGQRIWSAEELAADLAADPDAGARRFIPTGIPALDDMIGGLPVGGKTIVGGKPGMGKAQPLWSKILTPDGWKAMGQMRVGDRVCGSDGQFHNVTGVHPQGMKVVYRVKFADGGYAVCCDDHLWATRTKRERDTGRPASVRRLEIIRNSLRCADGRANHSIPYIRPVEFPKRALPLDPYFLGVYLGDGDSNAGVRIHNSEADVCERAAAGLPQEDRPGDRADPRVMHIVRRKRSRLYPAETKTALEGMGLSGLRSWEKYIPPDYLHSTVADRVWLLRGLFDTDGYVTDPGGSGIEFVTTSPALRDGVVFLVGSLGGRVTWEAKRSGYRDGQTDEWVDCRDAYRMNVSFHNEIEPVSSEKHLRKWKGVTRRMDRFIVEVERLGEMEQCQCITVDAMDNLYVTDDFILTHNSAAMKQIALNLSTAGRRVGYVSVEEPRRKVVENMAANLGDVANNRVAFGRLLPADRERFLAGARALSVLPLWVVDSARRLCDVRAAAQRLACEHGAEVVMVDHLHLIDPGAGENREREISVISAELKWCWKELGVCGVEAAQLNRKGGDDRPWLDNLRDSGSLEQDGDTILLLHREDYYRKSEPGYTPDGVLEAIVAKNKSGATGTVPLAFEESRQRITDLAGMRPVTDSFNGGEETEGMF